MRSTFRQKILTDGAASELGYEPISQITEAAAATELVVQNASFVTGSQVPSFAGGLGLINVVVQKPTFATGSQVPVLALGLINIASIAKPTFATASQNAVLALGLINLTVQNDSFVTKSQSPKPELGLINIAIQTATFATTWQSPTISVDVVPEVSGNRGGVGGNSQTPKWIPGTGFGKTTWTPPQDTKEIERIRNQQLGPYREADAIRSAMRSENDLREREADHQRQMNERMALVRQAGREKQAKDEQRKIAAKEHYENVGKPQLAIAGLIKKAQKQEQLEQRLSDKIKMAKVRSHRVQKSRKKSGR